VRLKWTKLAWTHTEGVGPTAVYYYVKRSTDGRYLIVRRSSAAERRVTFSAQTVDGVLLLSDAPLERQAKAAANEDAERAS
jgi:hypothetical protein